jgi:hypothetical protein
MERESGFQGLRGNYRDEATLPRGEAHHAVFAREEVGRQQASGHADRGSAADLCDSAGWTKASCSSHSRKGSTCTFSGALPAGGGERSARPTSLEFGIPNPNQIGFVPTQSLAQFSEEEVARWSPVSSLQWPPVAAASVAAAPVAAAAAPPAGERASLQSSRDWSRKGSSEPKGQLKVVARAT